MRLEDWQLQVLLILSVDITGNLVTLLNKLNTFVSVRSLKGEKQFMTLKIPEEAFTDLFSKVVPVAKIKQTKATISINEL